MISDKIIYFDNASTVKTYPEVLKTFIEISEKYFGNTSSTHKLGADAFLVLSKARNQIAKYFNVLQDEVIFTSSATEGNNIVINGVSKRNSKRGRKLITTKAEHPSVLNPFKEKEKEGFEVLYLDYDENGILDLNQLDNFLDDKVTLISIMKVNNEVGYIFNTDEVYKLMKKKSHAYLHLDATQAVGKEKIDSSYYDLLTFSGHKLGGIKGVGGLIKKNNVLLDPLFYGGGQEYGIRSSTVSTPLCCSLATAIRLSFSSLDERKENVKKINSYLRDELSKIDEIKILSPISATPFILSFALLKHKGSIVSEDLSLHNVFVSTKSACSSKEDGYSYVIKNAGFDKNIASNAIRLSFSGYETVEDCNIFIAALKNTLNTTKENVYE